MGPKNQVNRHINIPSSEPNSKRSYLIAVRCLLEHRQHRTSVLWVVLYRKRENTFGIVARLNGSIKCIKTNPLTSLDLLDESLWNSGEHGLSGRGAGNEMLCRRVTRATGNHRGKRRNRNGDRCRAKSGEGNRLRAKRQNVSRGGNSGKLRSRNREGNKSRLTLKRLTRNRLKRGGNRHGRWSDRLAGRGL